MELLRNHLLAKDINCDEIYSILQYLEKFSLVPVFTEEEFRHWFIPRSGIIDTYVVEGKNKEITGIANFVLPFKFMGKS